MRRFVFSIVFLSTFCSGGIVHAWEQDSCSSLFWSPAFLQRIGSKLWSPKGGRPQAQNTQSFMQDSPPFIQEILARKTYVEGIPEYSVGEALGEMGFTETKDPNIGEPNASYVKDVPFGNEFLQMVVTVDYEESPLRGNPNIVGKFPVGVSLKIRNDGQWAFYQTLNLNYRLPHPPYLFGIYTFEMLTVRKRLAVDLTRSAIRKFYKDGFERYTFGPVPDVELDFVRGNSQLTETDNMALGFGADHYVVFLYNFERVLRLNEQQFEKLRAQVPKYRRINPAKRYNPRPGEPYQPI